MIAFTLGEIAMHDNGNWEKKKSRKENGVSGKADPKPSYRNEKELNDGNRVGADDLNGSDYIEFLKRQAE